MHDLIVGALQEARIDGAKRAESFGREAGGEGHRVLLRDADIEGALGESFAENIDAGARRHGRGDSDDAVVLRGFLHEAIAKDLGVGRRRRLGLVLRAGSWIELDHAVHAVGCLLGGSVAVALFRAHMDDNRPAQIARLAQRRHERLEIVPVDRADVVEAELLEPRLVGTVVADGRRATFGLHIRLARAAAFETARG